MGISNPGIVGGVDSQSSGTAFSVRTDGVLYVYNLGPGGGGGAAFTAGLSNIGNTSGATGTVSNQLILAGGNNVTLSGSTDLAGGMTITISGANQSVQTQNLQAASLSGNTAGVLALISSGTMYLAGGNNITLSQAGQTITISAGAGGVFSGGISGGNTLGNTGTVTNEIVFAGGNNITLSGSTNAGGMSVTISGPNTAAQTVDTLGIYASSQTTGQSSSSTYDARSLTLVGQGIISAGWSNGSLLLSASTTQTVQTQGSVLINGSSGSIVFTAGPNISLQQNASTITISASNAPAQTVQSLGIYGSSQTTGQSSSSTYDARSLSLVGQGIISVGWSNSSLLISATTVAQTVQTQNLVDVSLSGNTAGALALVSSGTLILAGGNNITLSQNGQSVTISGANAGGAQTAISGIQVSNTTYTSGTVIFSNANGISFGSSAGQAITASYTVPTQTNQTEGIYASSQTVGQSSSSTYDARSLSLVGQGIVSVGWSNSSLIISATTPSQSVQTQNCVDISLSGNTAGALALISSGTFILAGGNNITVSQNGQSVTISGPNAGGAQTGISGVIVSNTTYTSGTISFVNSNGFSFLSTTGQGILGSYTVPTQTVQTEGIYASSQTVGQSSSSTYDARSLSLVGQGIVSVGWSNSSFLISATTPAQTVDTLGIYASSQTVGQSSSSTVDARSLTFVGKGNVSVGMSAGSILISASGGGAGGSFSAGISGGNTSGNTGTVSNQIVFAGGNNITMSGSTDANGMTATVSGPSITTAQLFASLGNTTGTSQALSSGSICLAGGDGITLSQSQNTVTISGGANYTGLSIQNRQLGASTHSSLGQNSVWFSPFRLPSPISASTLLNMMSFTGTVTSNATNTHGITMEVALYTAPASNQTSFSKYWSGSYGMTFWNSGTASVSYSYGTITSASSAGSNLMTASVFGLRLNTFVINSIIPAGLYAYGVRFSSSTAGGASLIRTANHVIDNPLPVAGGYMGAATNASIGYVDGGSWSATSGALPASFALTDVRQSMNEIPYVKIGAV
jgi:hypothetical protein